MPGCSAEPNADLWIWIRKSWGKLLFQSKVGTRKKSADFIHAFSRCFASLSIPLPEPDGRSTFSCLHITWSLPPRDARLLWDLYRVLRMKE